MHDAYIGGHFRRTKITRKAKCVVHDDLRWKNQTTRYILLVVTIWSFARVIAAVVTTTSTIVSSNKIQNGNLDPSGKWPLKRRVMGKRASNWRPDIITFQVTMYIDDGGHPTTMCYDSRSDQCWSKTMGPRSTVRNRTRLSTRQENNRIYM